MKITVESYDDSEEDCKRDTFVTRVDGKEYLLAPCSLCSYWTWLEIQREARKLFGEDVEIVFAPGCAPVPKEEPDYIKRQREGKSKLL